MSERAGERENPPMRMTNLIPISSRPIRKIRTFPMISPRETIIGCIIPLLVFILEAGVARVDLEFGAICVYAVAGECMLVVVRDLGEGEEENKREKKGEIERRNSDIRDI